MAQEGIMLGHLISNRGIEVDKAKIEVIANLSHPKCVKKIRNFLGHAGFYRIFIKDFSKIAKSLCKLLAKDVVFEFDKACIDAFENLKEALILAPVLQPPNWE